MKRTLLLAACALLVVLTCGSCLTPTPIAILDGFHAMLNYGSADRALSYVAEDAVFYVKAAPIAGPNGTFKGRESILGWLNHIVEGKGSAQVFEMDLQGRKLTCLLNYLDAPIQSLGLDSLELQEVSLVENGLIQSYSLTLLPAARSKFENVLAANFTDLTEISPADRKFFMAGHATQSAGTYSWLRNITPADRKFYMEARQQNTKASFQSANMSAAVFDWKFFEDGYIAHTR